MVKEHARRKSVNEWCSWSTKIDIKSLRVHVMEVCNGLKFFKNEKENMKCRYMNATS